MNDKQDTHDLILHFISYSKDILDNEENKGRDWYDSLKKIDELANKEFNEIHL